ncbi:MAG: hypothetical protein PHV81_04785 [Candidatus Methanomethylophilaceae archaeon]|jgi:hypothetical protein|nr:hypothetical protein [Candidatus Methanomethylophilaceae archaeon]NCA73668.1 hypothetical protein [Gammaproteobacteria bacterium]MDD2936619.1 hypothetical protein [Candidatus Methanomethylophilaceae archaeon]MDD3351311.1 hypothetical protein [Candidatus Methanomethylophilaceae archaeon]MDD3986683.1 hypothetical protein [Candidatus Methanomethylophilaceae archaeon]
MTMKITVVNTAAGGSIRMELEPYEKISDIIDAAADYWGEGAGAFVIRKGPKLLVGSRTVEEVNLSDGDTVEMIPDPEGGS